MILQSVGIPGFTAIVLASESNEQSVEVEMIEGGKSDASWEENEKIDKEGSLDENQRKDKNLLEETFSDSIFDERIENNKQGGCVVKMKL